MTVRDSPQEAEAEIETQPAPAGLLRRLAVMCYDALLLFGVLFAATLVILPLTRGHAIAPYDPLYTIYLLIVSFVYFGWFWTHGGQTLGMRAWGVHLLGQSATGVSWRECLVRFLAALVSLIPLGLGFLWAGIDREKRTWHDHISGTRLVVQSALRERSG